MEKPGRMGCSISLFGVGGRLCPQTGGVENRRLGHWSTPGLGGDVPFALLEVTGAIFGA